MGKEISEEARQLISLARKRGLLTDRALENILVSPPSGSIAEHLAERGILGPAMIESLQGELRELLAKTRSAEVEAEIPDKIGGVQILRELGRGGMGIVLEGYDPDLDRLVAVKILPGAMALQTSAAERFTREVKAIGRLDHPRIVRLLRAGQDEGIYYYIMEYVGGPTLDRALAAAVGAIPKRRFATPELLAGVSQASAAEEPTALAEGFAKLADALAYAHDQGVIHRDLKPSNVILSKSGEMKLLDFGLAMLNDAETITFSGDLLGTPMYMSPEQVSGGRVKVDVRTDVYSFGATMYEALTLASPFAGKTRADLFDQIMFKAPARPRKLNPAISKGFEAIVQTCLEKDPGARYQTAKELKEDLERFARGDPVKATRPSAPARGAAWVRGMPRRTGYGTVGLALITAAIIVMPFAALFDELKNLPGVVAICGFAGFLSIAAMAAAIRGSLVLPPPPGLSLLLLFAFLISAGFFAAGWGGAATVCADRCDGSLVGWMGTVVPSDMTAVCTVLLPGTLCLAASLIWLHAMATKAGRRDVVLCTAFLAASAVAAHGLLRSLGWCVLIYDAAGLSVFLLFGILGALALTLGGVAVARSARWLLVHIALMAMVGSAAWWGLPVLLSRTLDGDMERWVRADGDPDPFARWASKEPERARPVFERVRDDLLPRNRTIVENAFRGR